MHNSTQTKLYAAAVNKLLLTTIITVLLLLTPSAYAASCKGHGKPKATVTWKSESLYKANNGSVTFKFDDDKGLTSRNRTHIKFSIDGGKTYPYKVRDNAGSLTLKGLAPETYDIRARWGNNDCPVKLKVVNIRQMPAFELPVEVLSGDGSTSKTRYFGLKDIDSVDGIFLKIHHGAYRDSSVNDKRGAKASVRLNDGAWVDVTDETTQVRPFAKQVGGFKGALGLGTIELTMKLDGFRRGRNKIQFRFNGTDGFSTGYRIVNFNVKKNVTLNDGINRPNQIPGSQFVFTVPSKWELELNGEHRDAHTEQGERLWNTKVLRESSLTSKKIKANCSSCHAADGRDLKYFGYSNNSIIERSVFHGLTRQEGRQIANYIRSNSVSTPPNGRPWNPPYQPGPGLDSRPVSAWAAGAGLKAVLKSDIEMTKKAFGAARSNDISNSAIFDVININRTLNVREQPISLQLPDWAAWLPTEHPLDVFGDDFNDLPAFRILGTQRSYQDAYQALREHIETNRTADIIADGSLYDAMNKFAAESSHFGNQPAIRAVSRSLVVNDKQTRRPPMAHWSAVKQWELMHTFNLENKAQEIHGKTGEERGWFTLRRNVFEMAPHRLANDINKLPHQSLMFGKYLSTAWYQKQLTINAGSKRGYALGPVDWNYQPGHINGLNRVVNGPKHGMRYFLSHTKMLQQYNDGKKIGDSMLGMRQIHPGRWLFYDDTIFADIDKSLLKRLKTRLLGATIDLLERHKVSEWPRASKPAKDNEMQPTSYVPTNKNWDKRKYGFEVNFQRQYADGWFQMIPLFREQGVNENTLNRAIDWGKKMWPKGKWESLRKK